MEVSKYLEWVENIVSIPNNDEKVRMSIDYQDLNKESPKDNFPLLHVDNLVDNTTKHFFAFFHGWIFELQSIKMEQKDMEKTTFLTMLGKFCYKVIPFRLNNVGVTYQMAMVTLFHNMMHKEIEVYMKDMIANSQWKMDHIANLKKLF